MKFNFLLLITIFINIGIKSIVLVSNQIVSLEILSLVLFPKIISFRPPAFSDDFFCTEREKLYRYWSCLREKE